MGKLHTSIEHFAASPIRTPSFLMSNLKSGEGADRQATGIDKCWEGETAWWLLERTKKKCSNKHQKLVFAYSKWFGCSPPTTCRVNERQAVDRALCVTQALGLLMWKERKQGLNPQKGKWGKSVIQNGHCQASPHDRGGGTSHSQSPKESWYKRREVFLHRKKILAFQRLQMVAIPGHISDPNNGRKHRSKTFPNNN